MCSACSSCFRRTPSSCAGPRIRSRWRKSWSKISIRPVRKSSSTSQSCRSAKTARALSAFNPPTSATVTLQSNLNNHHDSRSTNSNGTTPAPTTNTNGLNLNTLGNLNATDFQVTIPSANLSAVMSNSDTKLIQNPQIRALDGQKASLKIGDRVPVATGSFQPGIGGVGINPLVNTQFQYLDVGVNIDITPRVHANGEVTLKISMDVSAVTGQQNIGGISQPIIGQRKIEHEIRLKDGEANLLGGIMEDQQTKSLAASPDWRRFRS